MGVKSAMRLFMAMDERDVVSWNSMISGLLKVGELSEARKLFDEMPIKDAEVLDYLVKLEPSDPGNYSLLSNIFASVGDWSNVANVRLQMKNFGIQKPSGASSIEVDDEIGSGPEASSCCPEGDQNSVCNASASIAFANETLKGVS
ncbi:hypothetical protein OIU84_014582 [Salix udensis]|uniref:Pentatricopeptide repeat-containing protein n=1 Tax=Salix udensis TaxID=889485 RepID=A0AAD6NRN8_9ROSI|nr:hypothetical protein OIU84_014582 [Salix udensis]